MTSQQKDSKANLLEKLAEQSKQLKANVTNPVYLINRNPSQIEHTTREMASKVSGQLNQTQITKVNSLLYKKGVDPDDLERKLTSLQVKSVEESEHLEDSDIEGYLYQKQFNTMLSAIEETIIKTSEKQAEKFSLSMESDWAEMMDVIVHSLGADIESVMKQDVSKPQLISGVPERNANAKKIDDYAKVINTLNQFRKNDQPFGLVTKLCEVGTARRDTIRALNDTWQLLKSIVREKNVLRDGAMPDGGPKEKEYSVLQQQQLHQPKNLSSDTFITGALEFLQEQYKEIILKELNFKASSVEIGGDPNLKSNILGYLNIIYPNHTFPSEIELSKGDSRFPIYAFIYFCLRVGDFDTALDVAKDMTTEFYNMLKFQFRGEGQPPSSLTVSNLYQTTRDPYKQILLNIIGKIDPNKGYSLIPRWSAQDWVWYQLQMINNKKRTQTNQMLREKHSKEFHLKDLQEQVVKYGTSHFNRDGKTPFLYFQILLMTQQFELAIDYGINHIQSYYIDIIHFAVSLYYYGMLNLHQSNYVFRATKDGKPASINIIQLLTHYTKQIGQGRIHAAVDYSVLIQDPLQKKQALQQLALDTRDYATLFGEKDNITGIYTHGILIHYLSPSDVKEIIGFTANELERDNRHSDAIIIFDLIDEYSEVFRILIIHLGRMLIPNPAYDRDRRLLITLTDQIFSAYTQTGVINTIDPKKRTTVQMLCHLVSFFNLFHTEDYVEALKFMIKLDLIPFHHTHIDACVSSFKVLDSSIQHNFAQIALVTMQCLYNVYERTGNSSFVSYWNRSELRQFAKLLILFVSRISTGNFMMPGDICATLSKLEVRLEY